MSVIARKSFLITVSKVIAQFIGWIGLAVLAKLWGGFAPEAIGIIGFAMSFIAMFDLIADLGFYQAHVKKVSEGKDLGTCIGTFAAIKILLTSLMVGVVLLSIFIWKNIFQYKFYDATTESVVYVVLVYYVLADLAQIATVTFEAKKEIAKRELTYIFETIKTPLMILVAVAGVGTMATIQPAIPWPDFLSPLQNFLANHAIGSLAMTYVFAILASFVVGLWLLRKYPIKKPSWELGKEYAAFALPIMLISVIGVISVNIDKIMLGFFWTSVEVGYFFSMQQIMQMLMILHIAVGTVLFPTFSEYHTKKDFQKIIDAAGASERYISMVMVPPVVVFIVFANPVIGTILSDAFYPAASTLIVLSIYVYILSLTRPCFALCSGINKPIIGAKIGAVMCCINIGLNFLLIPKNGLLSWAGINGPLGAAVSTIISGSIGFVWFKITVKKLIGVKIISRHIPRHIFAGFVMALVLYFSSFSILTIRWYLLIVFSFIGLAVYLGVLYILKEFNKKDLRLFLNILQPKEMVNYIKSELKEEKEIIEKK
ncbi:MAG TPA: oligosaccharide flippase family protein [Candidatus Thermoplasmatota archaeon]|nr:oligosaccharide flippase family protein [Candidatus Thermoplasmatota archaeon]